jgi:hypothetical protein
MRYPTREITEQELEQALERPHNFGGGFAYHGDNEEMFQTWSIGPALQTRDSGLKAESNTDAMLRSLEEAEKAGVIEPDSWKMISASHWGCGWVDHLTFKACDENREPTLVFSLIMEMVDCIQEYSVLDSSDYSERQYESRKECIGNTCLELKDDVPDNWVDYVNRWLYENDTDGNTWSGEDQEFVAAELVEEACRALGFLEPEEE